MRRFFLFILSALFYSVSVYAQFSEGLGINKEDFIYQFQLAGEGQFQNIMKNSLSLLDINNDNAISQNEINEAFSENAPNPYPDPKGKEEDRQVVQELFKQADNDNDNMLRGDEMEEFYALVQNYMIQRQFEQQDLNGDGVINLFDAPTPENSMAKMENTMAMMNELMQNITSTSPEDLANNFIANITSAIIKEDYYQMDKNHDNCVTKEEFADYQLLLQEQDKESTEAEKYVLSREDFLKLYEEEHKSSPNCLTSDDYIALMSSALPDITETGLDAGYVSEE